MSTTTTTLVLILLTLVVLLWLWRRLLLWRLHRRQRQVANEATGQYALAHHWARTQVQAEAQAHARRQGRLTATELHTALPLADDESGLPLAYAELPPEKPKGMQALLPRFSLRRRHPREVRYGTIGLPARADRGHGLVCGPAGSGKSFHLSACLRSWRGPAIVVDPNGEQWHRTAGWRAAHVGPVYRLPEQGLDLADYYDLAQDTDRRELYEVLLRPWQAGKERVFLDKAYALLVAATAWHRATGEHTLRALARWTAMDLPQALGEAGRYAPDRVRAFTDSTPAEQILSNRFATSSWGDLTTRYSRIAPYVAQVTARLEHGGVPRDWMERRGTIYLCWPLHNLQHAAPLIAATVAGLVRDIVRRSHTLTPDELRRHPRVLTLLDEAPALALPGLAVTLATVRSRGITVVLYTQSVAQLRETYGADATDAIVSNCNAQVYAPPQDVATAEQLGKLWGTELELSWTATQGAGSSDGSSTSKSATVWVGQPKAKSEQQGTSASHGWNWSTRERPALAPAEATALPRGVVAVFVEGKRALAIDCKSVLLHRGELDQLPPPPAVAPLQPARSNDQAEELALPTPQVAVFEQVRRLLIEGATIEADEADLTDSPASATASASEASSPAQESQKAQRRQRRGGHRRTAAAHPGQYW